MKRQQLRLFLVCATATLAIALGCQWFLSGARRASAENAKPFAGKIPLRSGLSPDEKMTLNIDETNLGRALAMYEELTGRWLLPRTNSLAENLDDFCGRRLSRWRLVQRRPPPDTGITYHRDGRFGAQEVKEHLESLFRTNGIVVVAEGKRHLRVSRLP